MREEGCRMREKRGGWIQDEEKDRRKDPGMREKRGGRIFRMREKRGGRIQDEGKERRKDTG
jgi:hypothetical protein